MPDERKILDQLVSLTKKQIERPQITTPMGTDEAAAVEEEQRRLAALRNPPRKY
jgi:hypothetical protein